MLPFDLFGKTILIIGFGRIGSRTAKRCLAMEMNVLMFDPYKPAADIKAAGCEPVSDLDAALPRADFVSIHCPKNAGDDRHVQCRPAEAHEAKGVPDQYRARRHCRRGRAVTQRSHRASLPAQGSTFSSRSRRPAGHALFALPNVIMAPHVAGVTVEAVDRMSEQTARNILSVLDGDPLRQNVINQDVLG